MSLKKQVLLVSALFLVSSVLAATEIPMKALTLPVGKSIGVNFSRTGRAPAKATMSATLLFDKAQTSIALTFDRMEPALLFAGDISSYVLWAVAIDGTADNLGEVPVDRKGASGSLQYYTSKRVFGLMVTAEPYTAVRKPSEIVLFTSGEVQTAGVKTTPFTFNGFQAGVKPALDSITGFQYADDTPVTYRQAQKVIEAAEKMNAAEVNPTAMKNAANAFASADNLFKAKGNKKEITDFSRIAVQLASQAIVDKVKADEAKAAAEAEAKRQAEKAALEQRAQAAETEADRVARELKEVQAQREALATESRDLMQQRDKMAAEKEMIAAERDKVAAERDAVAAERESIRKERDELARTLRNALSSVAETNETARGVIVSLPGILFDVNKATLPIASQLTVAKLAGILMVFQNMNLSIEGYTDATGTQEFNMSLSSERARAVYDFLKAEGIVESRMKYQGFGPANPVAPNDTEANRAKNRRVEVVLTQVKS